MKFTNRRQALKIVIAAFVLSGILYSSAHAETGLKASPAAVKASDNPCLKYLPADWWLVANLDIKAYLDFVTKNEGAENPMVAMVRQYIQLGLMYTGIDWSKDVSYSTLIVSGDPDGDMSYLGVIKGVFSNAAVRERLAKTMGAGMKEQFYGGQTIYIFGGMAYCTPAASTILVSDLASAKRAIDRVRKAPFKLPAELKSTLARTNAGAVVWTAVRPEIILNSKSLDQWRKDNSGFRKALAPIKYLSVFFEAAEDGFLASALACLPDTASAGKLNAYLAKRKNALLKTEGVNVFFCSFLTMSRAASDGRYVKGTLRLTGKALTELWNTKVIVKPK